VFNCPVKLDKIYEVDIETISPNGEGVALVDGFSVFIAQAKLAEHHKVRITRIDSISADAEITL
jgi:predicted RNA-binding protein with TRAM domain